MVDKSMAEEERWFATTRWCWEDILTIKPKWSRKRCENWLEDHEEHIKDAMISTGWDVINAEFRIEEVKKK